jgi:hypothetical protein
MVNFTEWLKEHNSDIQDPKKRFDLASPDS